LEAKGSGKSNTFDINQNLTKYQQLKKKSAATALNTVLASAHTQMT
jgi:hypothetical protein